MTSTQACAQCNRQYVPKSKVNIYCSVTCRWDASNGRVKAESVARLKTGFAWPLVEPAKARKVTVPVRKRRATVGKWKTALILPDQQFGYRLLQDGTFQPFHDPRAIEIAEMVAEAERPDLSVFLGDMNDLPAHGRFRQEPGFVPGVQRGLDRAAEHVATVAEVSEETRCLEGNHDARLTNQILDNALASAGLRRARRLPGEYPVLSIPYLLGFEDMKNVKWVGGYPAGATYINENFAAIHGRITGNNLVEKVLSSERVSVVMGHIHRIFDGMLTRNYRGGPKFTRAFSPGCLCRIDGAVPSTNSGLDPWMKPARSWENWQQGVAVVRYEEGDGRFAVEMVPIFEGWAMHRGQEFVSTKDVEADW